MFKEKRFIYQNIPEGPSKSENTAPDKKEAGKEIKEDMMGKLFGMDVSKVEEKIIKKLLKRDFLKEIKNKGLESELIDSLNKVVKSNEPMFREIASDKNTDPSVLKFLAELHFEYTNDQIRRNIANNPNTPAETLVKLSERIYDDQLRAYLIGNPNTPVKTMIKLSTDVRFYVAANPNTPVEKLIELSKDKDVDVRGNVAKNPNTPADTLINLSKDESELVRNSATNNANYKKGTN